MLGALVVSALALASPSFSVGIEAHAWAAGQRAGLAAEAADEGLLAKAESPLGSQLLDVRSACVPDWDAACDTELECEPGTLNCWVTRRPRPPWPCEVQPDGGMRCRTNGTESNQTQA